MFRQVKCPSMLLVLIGLLPALVSGTAHADSWSFVRVVEYAGSHSSEAAIARSRIEAAQAQLGQANAMLWPRVQLQTGYTQTNNPVAVFGNLLNQKSHSQSLDFNDVPRTDDLTARWVLSFPLYIGGRDSAKIAASTAGLEAARFDTRTIINLGRELGLSPLEFSKDNV